MTDSHSYAVVACSDCAEYWILDRRDESVTTTCPRCGTTYLARRRTPVATADRFSVAAELRARKLAARAGEGEAFVTVNDYGVIEDTLDFESDSSDQLTERAEAALGLFDDAFEAAVQDSIDARQEAFGATVDAQPIYSNVMAEEADAHLTRRFGHDRDGWDDQEDTDDSHGVVDDQTAPSTHWILTDQSLGAPTASLGPDSCSSRRDLTRELFATGGILGDALLTALDTLIGDVPWPVGEDRLVEEYDVHALRVSYPGVSDDYQYARLAAHALDSPAGRARLLQVTRQLGTQTSLNIRSSFEDLSSGPIQILAAADIDSPTVEIDISNLFELKSNQRAELLRYLRRLAPGARLRLLVLNLREARGFTSRPERAVSRTILHHAGSDPGDGFASHWGAATHRISPGYLYLRSRSRDLFVPKYPRIRRTYMSFAHLYPWPAQRRGSA